MAALVVSGDRSAFFCTSETKACCQFLNDTYSTPINITDERLTFTNGYNIKINNSDNLNISCELIRFWENREIEVNITADNTTTIIADAGRLIIGRYQLLYDNVNVDQKTVSNYQYNFMRSTDTAEHNYIISPFDNRPIRTLESINCYDNWIRHLWEGNVLKAVICPFISLVGMWFFVFLALLVAGVSYAITRDIAAPSLLMTLLGVTYINFLPVKAHFWGGICLILGIISLLYGAFSEVKNEEYT